MQQVALGAHHSLALTRTLSPAPSHPIHTSHCPFPRPIVAEDGEVFSWGSAAAGRLGLGPLTLMRRVTGSTRYRSPRCPWWHDCG